jgi:hypothetical protein
MQVKRPGIGAVVASAIGIFVCVVVLIYLAHEFQLTYRWAATTDKDHVAAYTGVLAAIASFVGALVSTVVNLFNALSQRSLESMKLELAKELENHKAALTRSINQTTLRSAALLDLARVIVDYRSALSLMEISRFTAVEDQAAEHALVTIKRQLAIVDESLKPAVDDFLQIGENIRGRLRGDSTVDQRAVWAEGVKLFGNAFATAERAVRSAQDALFSSVAPNSEYE